MPLCLLSAYSTSCTPPEGTGYHHHLKELLENTPLFLARYEVASAVLKLEVSSSNWRVEKLPVHIMNHSKIKEIRDEALSWIDLLLEILPLY